MKRLLLFITVAASAFGGAIVPKLDSILQTASPADTIAVIVRTQEQADLSSVLPSCTYDDKIDLLKNTAENAQSGILAWLDTIKASNEDTIKVEDIHSYFLVSDMSLTATPSVIRELASRSDVEWVMDDYVIPLGDTAESGFTSTLGIEPRWNIAQVEADACWAAGWNGSGIVVGTIDTGVDPNHSALRGRMRANGWFDALNGSSEPSDNIGHGTHTMGTICGQEGIGVAPAATYVTAKAWSRDDPRGGSASVLRACFDWMADTGRPNVLSNSWGSPYEYRTSHDWFAQIDNLRRLGVVVVFSIGNWAYSPPPPSNSSCQPGNFPNVVGVGAVDSLDAIADFSCLGPAPNEDPWTRTSLWPRTDWNRINPALVAPGVNVWSAAPGGGYARYSGTSMSCPHVAGACALLLQRDISGTLPLTPHRARYPSLRDALARTRVHNPATRRVDNP